MNAVSEKRIPASIFILTAFIGWFASGSLPLIMLSQPLYLEDGTTAADDASRGYSYLAVTFIIVALLSNPNLVKKAVKYVKQSVPIRVIIILGITQVFIAFALAFYAGAAYACFLLVCILFCSAFWSLPERNRFLLYKYLLGLNVIYVSLAFFIHGAPQNRWVGGIHPNIFSQASILLAFSGLMILRGLKRTLVILASLFISYVVDSRYALAAVLIMWFGIFILDSINWSKSRLPIAIGGLILFFIIAAYLETSIHFFTEMFALYDPDRGFSTGITGRAEKWSYFIPQLSERPFFGYGFRNRLAFIGSHNGFMQYILENGLVISIPFLSALFFILISNLSTVSRSISDHTFKAHEGRVVLVTFLAILFAANLQPQLISFGDEFGPLTLVILLYVPRAFSRFEQRKPDSNAIFVSQ